MRIRIGKTKGTNIQVRRVRKKQVMNVQTWMKYLKNHDRITRQEWEVIREKSEEKRQKAREKHSQGGQ